jgi:hypothetical protein
VSALRVAERGHRRPYGAAGGSAAQAASITEKTAKRFYPFDFLVTDLYGLIANASDSRLFPLSPIGGLLLYQRLSSGAALVNAAPLFQLPAIFVINQSAFTYRVAVLSLRFLVLAYQCLIYFSRFRSSIVLSSTSIFLL